MDPVTDNPPPDSGTKSAGTKSRADAGGTTPRPGKRWEQLLSQKPLAAATGALALGVLVGRLLR
jgi:hypothetical protein